MILPLVISIRRTSPVLHSWSVLSWYSSTRRRIALAVTVVAYNYLSAPDDRPTSLPLRLVPIIYLYIPDIRRIRRWIRRAGRENERDGRVSNDGRHADSRPEKRISTGRRTTDWPRPPLARRPSPPQCRRRRRNYLSDGGKADRTKWTWRLSRSTVDRCQGLRRGTRRLAGKFICQVAFFCYVVDGR